MIITTKISMDLAIQDIRAPRVHAVQNDAYTRNIEISLFAGGATYTPPEGITAAISYIKPDGKGGIYDSMPDGSAAFSITGSIILIRLAPQVLTTPGVVKLAVRLIKELSEICTFAVEVDVQKQPGSGLEPETYVNLSGILPASGWTPYKYLGTDGKGNVVVRDTADGPGVASVKSVYTENLITVTETLEDGTVNTYEIPVENGFPTKIQGNGKSVDLIWEGWS